MATRFVAHIFYMWLQKMSGDEKRFKHAGGGVSMAAISTASLKEVHLKKISIELYFKHCFIPNYK